MTDLESMVRQIVRDELARATPANDAYLTTREAGAFAKVADGTIRRWIRSGKLATHRAGRVMRVRQSDLVHLLRTATSPNMTPEAMASRDFG